MPAISIVMPCHNRAHDLIHTLRAYDQQKVDEPFEIIAIDDASRDATYGVLTSYHPANYTLKVERMEENRGPAASRNRGIASAKSSYILIVGDDILPDQNLVRGHLEALRQHSNEPVAILGHVTWPKDLPINTLMTHIDGIGAQQFSYCYLQDGQEYDFRHFYTANISIKRHLLYSLDHWFDIDFQYAAYEDAEFAYRLAKRGLRILYLAGIVGYHYHYHNIWTFSNRQRRSGMMVNVLTAKHPSLRYKFRAQYFRILSLIKQPWAILSPINLDEITWVETICNRLVSFYEWNDNTLLDSLYLAALDYYYYDGFIEGALGKSGFAIRLKSAHVSYYLVPTLIWFIKEAMRLHIALPMGYNSTLVRRLSDLSHY